MVELWVSTADRQADLQWHFPWTQDQVDDWSSPSSVAGNILTLLLTTILVVTLFGIFLRILLVCFTLFFAGFKYAVVCLMLLLFGAFLA